MARKNWRNHFHGGFHGVYLFLAAAVLLLSISLAFVSRNKALPQGTLEIRFLDVGQGDAALIVTEAGMALLDTGEASEAEAVCLTLSAYGERLEYLILSHPHSDHTGGASYILGRMQVDTVILPRTSQSSEDYTRLLKALQDSGTTVLYADPGLEFSLGDARFTVLAPLGTYEEENNASTVLRLDFGRTSALFTGDAEAASEADQLRRYGEGRKGKLRADILKVAHHGSPSSSGEEYLRSVSPHYAVISCGAGNVYGHPDAEVEKRLRRAGARILRTDLAGEIVFRADGRKILCVTDG